MATLSPVFTDMAPIVRRIIEDPADPSYALRQYSAWQDDFNVRQVDARRDAEKERDRGYAEGDKKIEIGRVTNESLRLFEKKRRIEGMAAERGGIKIERDEIVRRAIERGEAGDIEAPDAI